MLRVLPSLLAALLLTLFVAPPNAYATGTFPATIAYWVSPNGNARVILPPPADFDTLSGADSCRWHDSDGDFLFISNTCVVNADGNIVGTLTGTGNLPPGSYSMELWYRDVATTLHTARSYNFEFPVAPPADSYTLNDRTSNGNNLTSTGVTAVTTSLPYSGSQQAGDFEASESDKLVAADSSSVSVTGNLTLETWVKLESLPSGGNLMDLISKFDDTSDERSYGFGVAHTGGSNYGLRFRYSTDGTYQGANDVTTSWTPSTGVWYHLAVVLDTSVPNVKFYVDGTQQRSTITSNTGTSIYNSTSVMTVGGLTRGGGDLFFVDGVMDDARIWNTARTSTQINDNKSSELAGSESGLAAYFPLEIMSFDLTDKTSNANNLTNSGAAGEIWTSAFTGDLRIAEFEASESDKVVASDSTSLSPTGNLTLETWVLFESLPSSGGLMDLISKFNDGGNQRSYGFGLQNDSGTYKLRFRYSTDGTYQSANDVTTTWTPSTGTLYHVAVVLDTATPSAKFYVNGTQQGSTITSNTGTSIYNGTSELYLGAAKTGSGDMFFLDGVMSEVRIWNTARTSTQISGQRSTVLIGSESGLAANFSL